MSRPPENYSTVDDECSRGLAGVLILKKETDVGLQRLIPVKLFLKVLHGCCWRICYWRQHPSLELSELIPDIFSVFLCFYSWLSRRSSTSSNERGTEIPDSENNSFEREEKSRRS